MSNRPFDFASDNPERLLDEYRPEDLVQAVKALPCWTQRALDIAELAITDWASAAHARPRDREGLAAIHSLIQRLQAIQPSERQPPELEVAARYLRWDGMAQLLETRAHTLDHHRPEEVEQRTHMPALKRELAKVGPGAAVATKTLLAALDLSKARLSQLLALAEAAGLIERRKEGREQWVSAAGNWRSADVAPMRVAEPEAAPYVANDNTAEAYVPISPAGEEIRSYVRRPLQGRRPVGYDVGFLEAYHPNQTYYLPQSLCAQLHMLGRSPAAQAPAGTFARDILNRLLIDLSWASSRLEGNTYSRLDTERLLQFGQAAAGKDAFETQMILNHKAAIEYLVQDGVGRALDAETIVALHAMLSDGLLADRMACGRLRNRAVEIGASVYRPLAMPQRLEELFGIVLAMAAEIADPFEQAFFLMVHLPYLQPFEDVNKRVSRLAANIPLIARNLCPLAFIDVPERAYVDALLGVYELNRIELLRDVFVWAYERSCQQYVAVRSQLVPPDTFRLRYRAPLAETIRAIVCGGLVANAPTVERCLPSTLPVADRADFVRLVLDEFETLHAGNAIRFGLRPLEFEAWRKS